jgi:hypothetical protein
VHEQITIIGKETTGKKEKKRVNNYMDKSPRK